MTNKIEFEESCGNVFKDLELENAEQLFERARKDFNCELNTGRNLRHIRKNYLNLTKKDLAEKLNISEKTVYNWERKDLVKMANWLSVLSLIDNKPLSLGYMPQQIKQIQIKVVKTLDN